MNFIKPTVKKILISIVALTAFSLPSESVLTNGLTALTAVPPSPGATLSAPTPITVPVQTSSPDLIPLQTFDDASSAYCKFPVDVEKTGGLTYECTKGQFNFITTPNAGVVYKYVQSRQSFPLTESFTLEADLSSQVIPSKTDQNNYGFIFGVDEKHTYSLRFKGQYYRFEKNLLEKNYLSPNEEIHVSRNWNWNYSSALKPAGNQNHIQLTCFQETCDLILNQQLAARFNLGETLSTSSLALFAEVGYQKPFGKVSVDNLHLYIPTEPVPSETPFTRTDPLTSDRGTFSTAGLSGAYNRFTPDGFYFSPVVSFGYYGVKSEPALGDVSVRATVRLKADSPASSMYAGLVCRSSLDGMYFAVIRESGYFSVFRDSPTRPFTLLAEARSKAILPGGAANQLHLDCSGSNIRFYINGTLVASLQDSIFNLKFGRSGLFTKGGKNPSPDAILFSDFEVKELR